MLLPMLSDPGVWEKFYDYKAGLCCPTSFLKDLGAFIGARGYLPVCQKIENGERFPLPVRKEIAKLSTGKKRVVYTYPFAENTVLKLLTYLLLRAYDGVFDRGLYSFRPGRTAKDAVERLVRVKEIETMYAYKADVSNYFNSIPVPKLLEKLAPILRDDPPLLAFLTGLLTEENVLWKGKPVKEPKGIMAGTPLSAFFANVYLSDLDAELSADGLPWARYSDDIILFAPTEEALKLRADLLRARLVSLGLTLNPEKEDFFTPETGFVFLGFFVKGKEIDLAPASVKKMKGKMRRKSRALLRWADRVEAGNENAAKAFIRAFNRKLFGAEDDRELTWSFWFFPLLTTDRSLREIDRYAEDCLRYILSGKRTKGRFKVRYEDLKALGFKSLVHEYHKFKEEAEKRKAAKADGINPPVLR